MPTEVLVFLLGISFTIGFIFYMFFSSRHKERMAIIEKGGDIRYPRQQTSKNSSLKWGLILLCLGIALGIGIFFDVAGDHDGPFVTFPLVIAGAGLGMLLHYRMNGGNSEDTV